MARIVVAGAGVCGLGAALMLARDGHDVTVLERDPQAQPGDASQAWDQWQRQSVTQFKMGHILLARGRQILDETIPEVLGELVQLGATPFGLESARPKSITDWEPLTTDDRFSTLAARRPVLEQAFANVADRTDQLTVRRGVALEGLVVTEERIAGAPHVSGVRTAAGESVSADLVIDAMGRRSPMLRWLADVGASPAQEESVDSGFAYYGQYLQSNDGSLPETRSPLLTPFHGYSILTLPGDNGSWFIGAYAASKDSSMRILRNREVLHRLVGECSSHTQWLEGHEISDVITMTGVSDRDRCFVVDGSPIVTGMLPLADAWACTNPSLGRGMSIGLDHARRLQMLLSDGQIDPVEIALAWDSDTRQYLAPWHEATRSLDQRRVTELLAQCGGLTPEPDPADVSAQIGRALEAGAPHDQDVYRIFAEFQHCLDLPQDILARPGVFELLIETSTTHAPPAPKGPTRADFLEMVS